MLTLQTIRTVWQSDTVLNQWIPSGFLTLGLNPYDRLPRGEITVGEQTITARGNTGVAEVETKVQIEISSIDYPSLRQNSMHLARRLDQYCQETDGREADAITIRFRSLEMVENSGCWTAKVTFSVYLLYYG